MEDIDLSSIGTIRQKFKENRMKDTMFNRLIIGITVPCSILLGLVACSQETQNNLARKEIEFFEGHYKVTFANGQETKNWEITSGKITSRSDYYFFWADCLDKKGNKSTCYVQSPIIATVFEEVK